MLLPEEQGGEGDAAGAEAHETRPGRELENVAYSPINNTCSDSYLDTHSICLSLNSEVIWRPEVVDKSFSCHAYFRKARRKGGKVYYYELGPLLDFCVHKYTFFC